MIIILHIFNDCNKLEEYVCGGRLGYIHVYSVCYTTLYLPCPTQSSSFNLVYGISISLDSSRIMLELILFLMLVS